MEEVYSRADVRRRARGFSAEVVDDLFTAIDQFGFHVAAAPRLEAAHRRLLGAEPEEATVTETAGQLAFTELGRFAVEYRQAFGESPSVTLRQ